MTDLLKASDDPDSDRRIFFKAQIVFWLLGAVDGHAKNFSIFLFEGGRFRLAPLYDVMSAQPQVDAGQIRRNTMKLAMAVGDNRHYVIDEIVPRHFLQTARRCGLSPEMIEEIFEELSRDAPHAMESTLADLPEHFPDAIAQPIVEGLSRRLRLLESADA